MGGEFALRSHITSLEDKLAMEPSSRTPEGKPNRCSVCGKDLRLEPSYPSGDAPCPHCGHLLWFNSDASLSETFHEVPRFSTTKTVDAGAQQKTVIKPSIAQVVWNGMKRGALIGAISGVAAVSLVVWIGLRDFEHAHVPPQAILIFGVIFVGVIIAIVTAGGGLIALLQYPWKRTSFVSNRPLQKSPSVVQCPQELLAPLPIDSEANTLEESTTSEIPANAFEEAVLKELEKIGNPKGSWVQALFILVVSLLLFVGLGMRNNPIAFTVMLIGVLLFHEMGHYIGMRIFGYRNVKMFFIPFFGAAVSGQRTNAKSYQEAIVTLLGPLPGLCLSILLLGVAVVPGIGDEVRHYLLWAAALLGLINGFNLLPVFPLDGGRLLNQILFSRNRYLEGVFQFLAALAFIAYGATQGRYFVLFLGVMFVTSVGPKFKKNTIAQRIGEQFGAELSPMNGPIPLPIIRGIIDQVKSLLPNVNTAKDVAGVVFNVWEKMHIQPPSTIATVALLLAYLLAGLLTAPWLLSFFLQK
jgi:Zn-dependent protease